MGDTEASLLWAGCRPSPDVGALRAAIDSGADMARVADACIAQRVAPLLWRALAAAGVTTSDEPWAAEMKRDAKRCQAHALLVLPRLGPMVLDPLREAGLEPLVFKGAALVDRYPAPGLRPMDDADLILPAAQHDRAVDVLVRGGWRVAPAQRGHHHESVLLHPEMPGLPVEIHRELESRGRRSNRLTGSWLWARRRPGRIGCTEGWVLSPEDELLALAAHAAKPFHVFDRMVWAVDVAVVISAASDNGGGVDWERVIRLSAGARCRAAVAVLVSQAARLGAESPPEVRHLRRSGRRAAALGELVSPDWPLHELDWDRRQRLGYAVMDDWRQRLVMLGGEVVEDGVRTAPRRALQICRRAVRWRQPGPRPGGHAP